MIIITRFYGLTLAVLAGALMANGQARFTNGLVAYYPLDGDSTDGVGTNHGTVIAATPTADRFDTPNKALLFDGVHSYIQCSDSGLPAGNTPRTVALWTKVMSYPGDTYLMSYGVDGPTNAFYAIVTANAGYVAVGRSGGGSSPTWKLPSTNTWHHIAITYDGTTNVSLYSDGTYQGKASRRYGTWLTGSFFIGRYVAGFPPTFKGAIDDVRIYDRALSSAEVASLYNYKPQPTLALMKAVKPYLQNLSLGTNYQLQISNSSWQWTDHGSPFVATNEVMTYPEYFEVATWNELFFRVQVAP